MKIAVKVKTRARRAFVKQIGETEFEAAVNEPPADGKANAAVIAALAEHFGLAKSRVRLVSGQSSKRKLFEIL
jgi:uncharacterized protein